MLSVEHSRQPGERLQCLFVDSRGPPGTGKQQARLFFFFFFLYFAQFSYCWQKLRPSFIWCHGLKDREQRGAAQAMGRQGQPVTSRSQNKQLEEAIFPQILEGSGRADTLIWDFWPLELREGKSQTLVIRQAQETYTPFFVEDLHAV